MPSNLLHCPNQWRAEIVMLIGLLRRVGVLIALDLKSTRAENCLEFEELQNHTEPTVFIITGSFKIGMLDAFTVIACARNL